MVSNVTLTITDKERAALVKHPDLKGELRSEHWWTETVRAALDARIKAHCKNGHRHHGG